MFIKNKFFTLCCGWLALSIVSGCTAIPSRSAERTIKLREEINQKWTNELLSYAFEAAQGAAIADSISVSGPHGIIPAQLSDVEFWPGTNFVKSARILFIEKSLEPLATHTYKVSYGTAATPKADSDLKVSVGERQVELSTARIGARLLVGEKTYDAPALAGEVPGPLQSLRLGDGAWGGGSTPYGELKVKSYSAKLVESGPVLTRVECRYVLADDTAATFTSELAAGDSKLLWKVEVSQDRPGQGVDFQLGKVPGVTQVFVPKGWGQWAKDRTMALTPSNEPFARLAPSHSIVHVFADSPASVVLKGDAGELRIASRNSGAWVDPVKPFTYGGFESWHLTMIPKAWENWKRKQVPMTYAPDGSVGMKVSFASGRRLWSTGSGESVVGERLNEVKDMVLAWDSDPNLQHPRLFMSKAEVEAAQKSAKPAGAIQTWGGGGDVSGRATWGYLSAGSTKEAAATSKVVEQLRSQLGMLGDYDTMRYGIATAGMYDALIDTDLITPQERRMFRAQLAYLAYISADPITWSIERGMHSGNPNMSISYTLTQGIIAYAIPDHPMAKTWTDYATKWMDHWLDTEVGANGEWLIEGAHYNQVSITPLVVYAIAAKRGGGRDFINDPRLKKLMLFMAKQWTPADPQRSNMRIPPPVGRGAQGNTSGLFGVMARATAESDPAYSQVMQWMWSQQGYYLDISDYRLGGFEPLYPDRTLPAKKPEWKSELFPQLGVVFRNAVGDPAEHYLNIISHTDSQKNLDIWTPEIGTIASWFAYGKPVSTQFAFAMGYSERHDLFRGGVQLARNWGAPEDSKTPNGNYTTTTPQGFSTFPSVDYVAASYDLLHPDDKNWFPENVPAWPKIKAATKSVLNWKRQAMYMKDASALGPHYLLLRDTATGGQPTMWQSWSLTEKIGTPEQAKDSASFLKDKPGSKPVPASELPSGNRYTAVGQFGVDLEYFIASPTNTPRSTLRFGGPGGSNIVAEYQDLLHLQLPGDGSYFVAIFPRTQGQVAPAFSTLGGGKVIKVSGAFGTDYGFLSESAGKATAEGAAFEGTASAVQERKGVSTLVLSAPGKVSYKGYVLSSPVASSLRVEPKAITLNIAGEAKSNLVTLGSPRALRLAVSTPGVQLKAVGKGQYQLTVPGNVNSVQLSPA